MKKPNFFLLSRFNLNSPQLRARAGLDSPEACAAWSEKRAGLFIGNTLPSVLGQTKRRFTWIIGFDTERTPGAERALAAIAGHRFIEPVFVPIGREFLTAVRGIITERASAGTVVTTRLDTDDAIHRDFYQELSVEVAALRGNTATALCFPFGVKKCGRHFLAHHQTKNAFSSLAEPFSEAPVTVLGTRHRRLETVARIKSVMRQSPMWMQNIHGGNVSNGEGEAAIRIAEPAAMRAAFNLPPTMLDRLRHYVPRA